MLITWPFAELQFLSTFAVGLYFFALNGNALIMLFYIVVCRRMLAGDPLQNTIAPSCLVSEEQEERADLGLHKP